MALTGQSGDERLLVILDSGANPCLLKPKKSTDQQEGWFEWSYNDSGANTCLLKPEKSPFRQGEWCKWSDKEKVDRRLEWNKPQADHKSQENETIFTLAAGNARPKLDLDQSHVMDASFGAEGSGICNVPAAGDIAHLYTEVWAESAAEEFDHMGSALKVDLFAGRIGWEIPKIGQGWSQEGNKKDLEKNWERMNEDMASFFLTSSYLALWRRGGGRVSGEKREIISSMLTLSFLALSRYSLDYFEKGLTDYGQKLGQGCVVSKCLNSFRLARRNEVRAREMDSRWRGPKRGMRSHHNVSNL